MGGLRPPPLMTSDEYPAYSTAIEEVLSEPILAATRAGAAARRARAVVVGQRDLRDRAQAPGEQPCLAVEARQVFSSPEGLEDVLGESVASHRVNTSFVERQDANDRGRKRGRPERCTSSARIGSS